MVNGPLAFLAFFETWSASENWRLLPCTLSTWQPYDTSKMEGRLRDTQQGWDAGGGGGGGGVLGGAGGGAVVDKNKRVKTEKWGKTIDDAGKAAAGHCSREQWRFTPRSLGAEAKHKALSGHRGEVEGLPTSVRRTSVITGAVSQDFVFSRIYCEGRSSHFPSCNPCLVSVECSASTPTTPRKTTICL